MQPPGNLQPNLPQQSQQASGQQQAASGTNQGGQVRRSLTLTKDQMMEAQEMFRTANKVTRPEKALILGFMAGSRENPCPHLGRNYYRFYVKAKSCIINTLNLFRNKIIYILINYRQCGDN